MPSFRQPHLQNAILPHGVLQRPESVRTVGCVSAGRRRHDFQMQLRLMRRAGTAVHDLEPVFSPGLCFLNCRAMRDDDVISTGSFCSVVLWLNARSCKRRASGLFYLAISELQTSSGNNLKIRRCHINTQISRLLQTKHLQCVVTLCCHSSWHLCGGCPVGRAGVFWAAF